MNDANARPVQLHVIHDLGGGSAKWLADYVKADTERTNLVLRSFAHDTAAGIGISLHEDAAADSPALRVWTWSDKIAAAAVTHEQYRAALDEIVRDHGVGGILVSSLIGHSLEALDTGLPTVVVNHDYFPYCPSINLYFKAMCEKCDGHRVAECEAGNPQFNAFAGFGAAARVEVRERFVELVLKPNVTMVTPSASVADNLRRLDPRFQRVRFVTIPHGYGNPLPHALPADPESGGRLRILVLGQLSVAKGVELLRAALDRITAFADVHLVGCRELGEEFRRRPHVHVISDYDLHELPGHIANIRPHLGLLLSIVPETFSYALSELMMLGVPVAATRLGSFAERIRNGVDGYLFDPHPDALVALVAHVDSHRDELQSMRAAIAGWRPRTARVMVADYHAALPISVPGAAPARRSSAPGSAEFAAQALTLASMWKDVKALHRHVALLNEARDRDETGRREQDRRHASEREALQRRIENANKRFNDQEEMHAAKDVQLERMRQHAGMRDGQVAALLASTSWRISAPVRWVGKSLRNLIVLARCIRAGTRQPSQIGENFGKVVAAGRSAGIPGMKAALLSLQPVVDPPDAWAAYQQAFRTQVRPRIVERIGTMQVKPRISILVPTYNTPEDVLREMLASVQAQLYPEWELCIADDGSTARHVVNVLQEHAARDPRIKLHLDTSNRGVSHASNRALELATGEFAVLLDHDDILEEQALFRVAESLLQDKPDMVYSDEILVSRGGAVARKFVYRPAFSLEYLRGHPYIVHMVGFRTALLREIGGFDESMRISQDYDLILRAVEKARRIVHIPELLYRWRIHGESAGHARMHEVMEVSTAALQRHLDRCGAQATAREGAGFNLFDVRYPVSPGVRVAIVIPTRNHGDILKQCIESIQATVKDVQYDIIVLNHDSDDPATLQYLATLPSSVRVLAYSGVFNFSAINNWAVAQLAPVYSHYLLCNNDIEALQPGWLERMASLAEQDEVGIVGVKLLYPDHHTIQHGGVLVGAFRGAEHYGKFLRTPAEGIEPGYECSLAVNREVSAVTAACMLVRREVFEAVGGFDTGLAVGFGDVDFCLRVRERGHRIIFCGLADLLHHESYTRGTSSIDPHPADTAQFQAKWTVFIQKGDPFYNPGLSVMSTAWATRSPLHCSFEIERRVYRRERPLVGELARVRQPSATTPKAVAHGE
ncbi:MAG: glycosyltransferase [Burkholderiales bacterium]|nr:glycosyltransferase [Burkholderiales bacterium]